MGNPVVHFEIGVKDANAANKFYGQLFGWKIDANNPMSYGIVDTDSGGEGVGGGIMKPPEGAGTYTTFYVNVEDLQATLDQAEKLGAKTIMPPMEVPERPRDRDVLRPRRERDRPLEDVAQARGAGASRST